MSLSYSPTKILDAARALVGTAYSSLDCSNFVHQVYDKAGLKYTYCATKSFPAGTGKSSMFLELLDNTEILAGDVVLFPGHMGIWDPEGCRVIETSRECKRFEDQAPVLSSRSGKNLGVEYGKVEFFTKKGYSVYRWKGAFEAVAV